MSRLTDALRGDKTDAEGTPRVWDMDYLLRGC
jgi:hypothetical protein